MAKDMKRKYGYPNATTFVDYFGSWNAALQAANFDLNRVHYYTQEEIIADIIRASVELNRVPISEDMTRSSGYVSCDAIREMFGNFNNGLVAAGLEPNLMHYEYTGDEYCSVCGTNSTSQWIHIDETTLICNVCRVRNWRQNHPERVQMHNHKEHYIRKGYGSININKKFKGSHCHHLWLENKSDFDVYIPNFLHTLNYHDHHNPESMIAINAIALDFWINEDFYIDLYCKSS